MPATEGKKEIIFENLSDTPQLAEGYNYFDIIKMLFNKSKEAKPSAELPHIKTDLKQYYSKKPSIIWFGHSSYLIHADGVNILVDPVLSGYASPFSFQIRAFKGADNFKTSDMPKIDWLILTHNHYDHLDYNAIKILAERTSAFIMPLEVSNSLRDSVDKKKITELNWWQSTVLSGNIKITATPARHFSGRGLKRNRSLWTSYVLEIENSKIFIGGDSGYDTHFSEIGKRFGPIDLALLECGQYNEMWPYIHSMPEECIKEARDLNAKVVMPVHWGKFALAMHAWDEPIQRFVAAAQEAQLKITTPHIGEPVVIDESYPNHSWWLNVK